MCARRQVQEGALGTTYKYATNKMKHTTWYTDKRARMKWFELYFI